MENRTIKYSVKPSKLAFWQYGGPYPGACIPGSLTVGSTDTITKTYQVGSTRTLQKGDHIAAVPFTGVFREVVPFDSELTTVYRNFNSSDPDRRVCGDKAGSSMVTNMPVGYAFPLTDLTALPPDLSLEKRLRDAAETKALASLRKGYYNLGIILAERKRSIQYLTDKVKALATITKRTQEMDVERYLRTKYGDRRRVAREIAGEHLAFLFGLLPLIDEIKGIAQKISSEETLIVTGRGKQALDRMLGSSVMMNVSNYNAPGGPVKAVATIEDRKRYSFRCALAVDVVVSGAQNMREHGLNPIATFYDIVPLSFLSDFISNTGTFLRALDPAVGLVPRSLSSTLWREHSRSTNVTGGKGFSGSGTQLQTWDTVGGGNAFQRYLYVQRFALDELPTPTWLLQNNVTLAKAATVASLAIQRYVKPLRAVISIRPFRYRGKRPKYLPPIKYR